MERPIKELYRKLRAVAALADSAAALSEGRPIEYLLRDQRNRKPLTLGEKQRIQQYAEQQRKKKARK